MNTIKKVPISTDNLLRSFHEIQNRILMTSLHTDEDSLVVKLLKGLQVGYSSLRAWCNKAGGNGKGKRGLYVQFDRSCQQDMTPLGEESGSMARFCSVTWAKHCRACGNTGYTVEARSRSRWQIDDTVGHSYQTDVVAVQDVVAEGPLHHALSLGMIGHNLTREDCIWRRGGDRDHCPDPNIFYYLYTPGRYRDHRSLFET
ncbi:hypothetical protein J6590_100247 [Homalodisca vitripennis]|nr:hypothetical protein J6590_100247 [Homalodisca vitripennis]